MKISCELEKFKKAVVSLSRITTKKEQNEILSSLFFLIEGKKLTIRATNLSIGGEFIIPIQNEVIENISFCLNAQNIQNIFSSITNDKNTKEIQIEINENTIQFIYKKNKLNIKKQTTSDTPTLPKIQEESFIIDKQTLKEGIQTVLSTASKIDIKPELSSVFISQQEGRLVFATTDTFRLTEYSVQTKKEYSFPSILIPIKNAAEICKILDDSMDENVEVYPSKNQISFITKDVYITSQLINGVFPDYTKIIPTIKHGTVSFLKTDLQEMLKMLNPFMDTRNQVKCTIDSEKQEIRLYTSNDVLGEYTGQVPVKIVGDSFELLINKNFFEDILQKMPETVEMIINQPQKPILIHSKENKEVLCLLMPMSQ
jgi:DNA polymerase-3 subunit beta